MRKSGQAVGSVLALVAVGLSTAAQAQEGCEELRAQYRGVEALAATPMNLAELRGIASDMASIRIDVAIFDAVGDRLTAAQWSNLRRAQDAITSLATQLGVGCDPSMTPTACADNLVSIAADAVRLADPGGFRTWWIEDHLIKLRATENEQAIGLIAQSAGIACPTDRPCKNYLAGQLAAAQREAELAPRDSAVAPGARDARAPLIQRLKNQLLFQMGELRCGEGSEVPPPPRAQAAPREAAPPPQQPPARPAVPRVPEV